MDNTDRFGTNVPLDNAFYAKKAFAVAKEFENSQEVIYHYSSDVKNEVLRSIRATGHYLNGEESYRNISGEKISYQLNQTSRMTEKIFPDFSKKIDEIVNYINHDMHLTNQTNLDNLQPVNMDNVPELDIYKDLNRENRQEDDHEEVEIDPMQAFDNLDAAIPELAAQMQIVNERTAFIKMNEYAFFQEKMMLPETNPERITLSQVIANLGFEADQIRQYTLKGLRVEANDNGMDGRLITQPLKAAIKLRGGAADGTYLNIEFDEEIGRFALEPNQTILESHVSVIKNILQEYNTITQENISRQIGEIAESIKYHKDHKMGFIEAINARARMAVEEKKELKTTIQDIDITTQYSAGDGMLAKHAVTLYNGEAKNKNTDEIMKFSMQVLHNAEENRYDYLLTMKNENLFDKFDNEEGGPKLTSQEKFTLQIIHQAFSTKFQKNVERASKANHAIATDNQSEEALKSAESAQRLGTTLLNVRSKMMKSIAPPLIASNNIEIKNDNNLGHQGGR